MRPSDRTVRGPALLALLLCAALAGTTMLVAATYTRPDNRAEAPVVAAPGTPGEPSAADLTRRWAAYGERATCADWSGADGMQAVGLGGGKTAWFFADTYLGPIDRSDPQAQFSKPLINNSLVIESIADGRITRTTVTGGGACPWDRLPGGKAQALVKPERRGQWYWGGDGVLVGDRVVKFYNRYRGGGGRYLPLGTAIVSFPTAELTKEPPDPVMDPKIKELPRTVPVPGGSPIMWGSAIYEAPPARRVPGRASAGDDRAGAGPSARRGTELYIYGWQVNDLNEQRKRMYLARVPKHRVSDFRAWRFYAGGGTWARAQAAARPVQPPELDFPVSTAWSVVRVSGRYWLVQHEPGLDNPDVAAYPADNPWGPFDPTQRMLLFRAPDVGRTPQNAFRIIYEARVLPVLSTPRTLVIGYNLNTTAVSTGCRSLSHYTDAIYRPQFLTVPTADFPRRGQARTPPRVKAGANGPPPGTDIVTRHPGQWHDTWRFPLGSCPPMPRIPAVQVRADATGKVTLSWPNVGLDVAYRVYHRERGGAYTVTRTLGGTSVTLSGYQRGKTYDWRVVPVNVKGHEGPSTTAAARIP